VSLPAECVQSVIDSLHRDGIAVVRVEDLLPTALWNEARADAASFALATSAVVANDPSTTPDGFLVRRFFNDEEGAPEATFTTESPWVRMAASDALLDIVEGYHARPVKIFEIDNWYTVPMSARASRRGSQKWHRDPEEPHVVKVFVYLSDVGVESGPFEYVRRSATGSRYGDLWPLGGGVKHPDEKQVAAAIPAEDRISVTGPAGTMIFCITGGLHRGGYARTAPRVMALWTYVTQQSKRWKRHRFRMDFNAPDVSPRARFALE
jgi:hypothetical protein